MSNSTFDIQHSILSYRYPGSRPFQDTDIDRCLFFGREEETQAFSQLVLVQNLVVLFAKSGTGKTSLLNADILQPLREQNFMPLKVRFNDPKHDPLYTVYQGIKDMFTSQRDRTSRIEYIPGQEKTLWEYFKTAEFWSADNKLLTPVLVLDQFEDFFDFHSPEKK
jgi:hypothetical protein